jgi:Fur family ferric uptake transcriptional regulator
MSKAIAAKKRHSGRRAELLAVVTAYMQQKRLRSTEQRRTIVGTFLSSADHVTIEELVTRVKEREPRVSYATVYRTLRLLVECGVAEERHFDRTARFEVADEHAHHDHLICTTCGSITEFAEPRIEALQTAVAARFKFRLESHKLEMYGVCERCNRARAIVGRAHRY